MEESPDRVSPASGRDGYGRCKFENPALLAGHLVADYVPGLARDLMEDLIEELKSK